MSANDEPCMCGTPFTCLADDHDYEVARLSGGIVLDDQCPITGRRCTRCGDTCCADEIAAEETNA